MEEKRKEKEKLDRQWGLVGLGQDSYTGQMASAKPWYASKQPPNAAAFDGLNTASAPHGAAPFGIQRSAEEKEAKDARNKAKADPVADMNKYLGKTRRHKEEKKKRRHDSDRRGSRHKGSEDTGLSEAEKRAKLEKLRSERLAREAGERARVAEIMGMGRTGAFSKRHAVGRGVARNTSDSICARTLASQPPQETRRSSRRRQPARSQTITAPVTVQGSPASTAASSAIRMRPNTSAGVAVGAPAAGEAQGSAGLDGCHITLTRRTIKLPIQHTEVYSTSTQTAHTSGGTALRLGS